MLLLKLSVQVPLELESPTQISLVDEASGEVENDYFIITTVCAVSFCFLIILSVVCVTERRRCGDVASRRSLSRLCYVS